MAKRFPSQQLDQFLLRLPAGMREKLGVAARANNRTMTAEIISRLETSLEVTDDSADADILIELQHQLGQVTKMIEDLPTRMARVEAGSRRLARPRSKKKV